MTVRLKITKPQFEAEVSGYRADDLMTPELDREAQHILIAFDQTKGAVKRNQDEILKLLELIAAFRRHVEARRVMRRG